MSVFTELPAEILGHILLELDVKDLTICQQVCRRVRAVIDSSSELQYKIHLARLALIDGVSHGAAVADRLAAIKAHQRTWEHSALTLDPAYSSTDAAGGEQEVSLFNVPLNGPMTAVLVGQELRLSHPRSPTRGLLANEWRVNLDRARFIADCGACDLSRDVVVICGRENQDIGSFYCLIFSLRSDGKLVPHPLAGSSAIWLPVVVNINSTPVSQVSVCGDFLACVVISGMFVYNWKTGQRVLDLNKQDRTQFQLLDEGLLLTGRQDALYVYAISPHPLQPSTQAFDPPPVCTLQLPSSPGHDHVTSIRELECQIPGATAGRARGAFQHDPASTLVVISFDFFPESGDVVPHILCIPRTALLARIDATVRAGSRRLPWEDWAIDRGLLLRLHGELGDDTKHGMSVSAAGSRVAVTFTQLFNTTEVGGNPLRILVDTFVFHAHQRAFTAVAEDDMENAEKYFDFVSGSDPHDPRLLPAGPRVELRYNVYHKSVRIGARESMSMPVPMVWTAKLFEDGLAVMREEHSSTDLGPRYRLTHSYKIVA